MPTYTYNCSNCGELEFYQSMYESTFVICPNCESCDIRKTISVPAVKFIGPGFYNTDNKKSGT